MGAALVLATAAAACGGGGSSGGGSSASTAAPTTAGVPSTAGGTTVPPTALTLRITDLRLANSEEADNAVRVLLPAGVASASITINGLPSPNQVVSVCQATDLDRRFSGAACRTPTNGQATTLPLGSDASGVEIVQQGTAGAGGSGNVIALDDVTIKYSASSRQIRARLPQVAAGEAGGRPSFALTPAGTDPSYQAMLSWTVVPVFGGTPSSARLELVQGGNVTNQAEGGADVKLTGTLSPPGGDAAIRITNAGSSALVTPKLTAVLP